MAKKKVKKIKKSLFVVFAVFTISMILLAGQAINTFWSGATYNWEESIYSAKLEDKIIIIDPGHGGRDPGVTFNGVAEKDINLAVAEKLAALLKAQGAKVIFTRDAEEGHVAKKIISLKESSELLNKRKDMVFSEKASLFISLHVNSLNDSSARGSIVFYKNSHFLNKILAEKIQLRTNQIMGTDRAIKEAEFVVLTQDKVPSVLVEVGFLTNSWDFNLLNSNDGQQKIANAIYSGIQDYGKYLAELQKIDEEQNKQ